MCSSADRVKLKEPVRTKIATLANPHHSSARLTAERSARNAPSAFAQNRALRNPLLPNGALRTPRHANTRVRPPAYAIAPPAPLSFGC